MKRLLLNLLTAVSVLLPAAATGLWVRSWRAAPAEPDCFSGLSGNGQRWTLVSERGHVTFFRPPRPPATAAAAKAEELVDALSISQIDFQLESEESYLQESAPPDYTVHIYTRPDTPASRVAHGQLDEMKTFPPPRSPNFSSSNFTGPLLSALEDPDRFIVAHLILTRRIRSQPATPLSPRGADKERFAFSVNGLSLRAVKGDSCGLGGSPGTFHEFFSLTPKAAADQFPLIRAQWHRRLDLPAASAPWWALAIPLAAVPATRLGVAARRSFRARTFRRRGHCQTCGYDLRATPGRCPECGVASGHSK